MTVSAPMADNDTAAAPDAVKAAEFPDLGAAGAPGAAKPNLDMVRDIEVTLTVELGRCEMLIQDILELSPGKVIALDKRTGEPLEVLVNGKLLARGEVVMVDGKYGIRITAIVDGKQREEAVKG